MKKNIISYLTAAAFLLTAAVACEDITKEDERPNPPITVEFEGKIVNLDNSAVTDPWNSGQSVGVFMKKNKEPLSAESILNEAANRKFVVGEGKTLLPADEEQEFNYVQDGSKVDFVAYSPYSNQLSGYSFAVDITQQYASAGINLLVSGNAMGKYKGKNIVKLDFYHALSQVVINVTAGEGVDDSDLAELQATMLGMYVKGDFSLATLTVDYDLSSADDLSFALDSEGKTGKLLVLPTAAAGENRSIVFRLPGLIYTYTLDPDLIIGFGKTLTLKVKVGVSSIDVSVESIEDWEVETESGSTSGL